MPVVLLLRPSVVVAAEAVRDSRRYFRPVISARPSLILSALEPPEDQVQAAQGQERLDHKAAILHSAEMFCLLIPLLEEAEAEAQTAPLLEAEAVALD